MDAPQRASSPLQELKPPIPLGPPPEAWAPARQVARRVIRPLERFLHIQASSGIVLLLMAVIAMLWANSPWKESYFHLLHIPVGLSLGGLSFSKDVHFVINDILMVVFFFVVGLEIRRELYSGELRDWKRASLPVIAALGGMLIPAAIYLAFNVTNPAHHGWGVPMATDIAFAVGVLALLGKRVPSSLRILLLALAIIDDIGAILVIALFYSAQMQWAGLGLAALALLSVIGLKRFGVRQPLLYVPCGIALWAGFLWAGIHPTIAGVILGLLTPARPWYGEEGFLQEASAAIKEFAHRWKEPEYNTHDLVYPLGRLQKARREALAPALSLEAALNPWVAFGIMPLFALANAGVTLEAIPLGQDYTIAIALGVGLGLVLGKPLGIFCLSWVAIKLGLSSLPQGLRWRDLVVLGTVGGIGFTMALFIAQLAFDDPTRLGAAKVAVLGGSALAGLLGLALGLLFLSHRQTDRPEPSAAPANAESAEA